MKKILLTSTALFAFGAAANAEVIISGNAEFGIFQNSADGPSGSNGDVEFFQDVDVDFTLVGETDNGLAFGANVDLDEAGGLGDSTSNQGVDVFVSGGFGTITVGDTDGALDFVLQEVGFNNGSIADDETAHAGYSGNGGLDGIYDGQIARYDFTTGQFGFAVSVELDDNEDDIGQNDAVFGVGVRYDGEFAGFTVGFGAAYQRTEVDSDTDFSTPAPVAAAAGDIVGDYDMFGVSLDTSFQDFQIGVTYTNLSGPGSTTSFDHFGVGAGYGFGAFSFSANYGFFDVDNGETLDGFGLSAGYDLGGGAALQAGYGDGEGDESFSVGIRMNF